MRRQIAAESQAQNTQSREISMRPGEAIIVLGPSSSGKTTLCDALAQEFQVASTRYIKEIARTVMKEQGFSRKDTETIQMQIAIMSAQAKAEANILALADPAPGELMLLSDRSAIDPIIYASTAAVHTAQQTRRELLGKETLLGSLPLYRRSLIVVLHPVTEWVMDDGVRSLEDPIRYNEVLLETLRELGLPFIEIGGNMRDLQERVQFIKQSLRDRVAVASKYTDGHI